MKKLLEIYNLSENEQLPPNLLKKLQNQFAQEDKQNADKIGVKQMDLLDPGQYTMQVEKFKDGSAFVVSFIENGMSSPTYKYVIEKNGKITDATDELYGEDY